MMIFSVVLELETAGGGLQCAHLPEQINYDSSEESAAVSAELFQEVRTLESTTSRFHLKNGGKNYHPQLPSGQH